MSVSNNSMIAGYLDGAGNYPAPSCLVLKQCGIDYCVITNNAATTEHIVETRKCIINSNMTPICLTNRVYKHDIQNCFNLASYLSVPFISFNIEDIDDFVDYIYYVGKSSSQYNIIAMIETSPRFYLNTDSICKCITENKCYVLYNPANIIIDKNVDILKFWDNIKQLVKCVNVYDAITSRCFKPPGFGNCRICDVINQISDDIWLFLDQRRVGNKSQLFIDNFDAFSSMVKRC